MSVRLPTYRAGYVWLRNVRVYLSRWTTDLWPPFIEPVVALLALGFGLGALVAEVDGRDYLAFIAPGIAGMFAMFAATFECTYGSWFRLERQKTFDAMIATPVSVEDVVTGEVLYGATRVTLSGVAFLIPALLLGATSEWTVLLFVPLIALQGLLFSTIALTFTSIAPSINFLNFFFTLFVAPMLWVSGTFAPVEVLPAWIQPIVWLAPLTHAVALIRASFYGSFELIHLANLAVMAGLTLLFYFIVLRTMRRRLVK